MDENSHFLKIIQDPKIFPIVVCFSHWYSLNVFPPFPVNLAKHRVYFLSGLGIVWNIPLLNYLQITCHRSNKNVHPLLWMLNHISCEESKLLREKHAMLNVGLCSEFRMHSSTWKWGPLPASWGLRVTKLLLVVASRSPGPCLNMRCGGEGWTGRQEHFNFTGVSWCL